MMPLQGGYESYGDYEPHTGDPQYDLEYDRSYYQMPDLVSIIILDLTHMNAHIHTKIIKF